MGVTILVGTTKGAFLIVSEDRESYAVRGPLCEGWPINHVVGDAQTGHLWAGGGGDWHGAGVFRSTDRGESWELTKLTSGMMDDWAAKDPDFAAMIGWSPQEPPFGKDFAQVWSLNYTNGALYAGTKPAQLLESRDGGESFAINTALQGYEEREKWNPGGAGLTLHTIVPDPANPQKLWLGISAAGVFATEDGGQSWERRNRMSNAKACEHQHHPAGPSAGEVGHCVHNIQRANGDGDVLYQQNHHGVWRSADGGRSWEDVSAGLPSHFGFPIAVNPWDGNMVWTIPLNGDSQGRFPPDAKAAVWKSSDGGQTWADKRNGLPQEACFFTVLRQAMATDQASPNGVYFGTNTGSVFASADEGETWAEVARHLPTILCVEVLEHG